MRPGHFGGPRNQRYAAGLEPSGHDPKQLSTELIMKKLLVAFVAAALSGSAAVPTPQPPGGVALRYALAADAYTALRQQLGGSVTAAVSAVDETRNVIAVDAAHPQAPVVRAFLTGLDHRPPQIRLDATITRRVEATSTSAARSEVLAQRTVLTQPNQPVVLSLPGDPSTQVQVRVTQIAP